MSHCNSILTPIFCCEVSTAHSHHKSYSEQKETPTHMIMSSVKAESGNTVTTSTTAYSTVAAVSAGAFQLQNFNCSNITTGVGGGGGCTTTTSIIRNNVSVTNIKCEADDLRSTATSTSATLMSTHNGNIVPVVNAYFNGGGGCNTGGGIRIPVSTKAEDSDSETELSNIENLKVTRRASASSSSSVHGGINLATKNNGPRPMSWEGELSEPETDLMETENSASNDKQYLMAPSTHQLTVIKNETSRSLDALGIKPEMDHVSVEISSSLFSPSTKLKLSQQHYHHHHHHQHQQQQHQPQSDPINLKYEPGLETSSATACGGGLNSPLLAARSKTNLLPANPSPDSAIHSVYTHSSPSQSPLTSRHAPYTPSLSRNNSDASHSSCYSYSSEFSPTHSPIQARHNSYGNFNGSLHHSVLYRPIIDGSAAVNSGSVQPPLSSRDDPQNLSTTNGSSQSSSSSSSTTTTTPRRHLSDDMLLESDAIPSPGISRQQLINSPCPICGDKISGFHYGIFSCESCKGFFKRTVQNRKNYVCVRGGPCPVTISTRKKCPACRFEKCLQKGMKLEAIREDRTRGGRSTYQCSYTLPNSMLSPLLSPDQQGAAVAAGQQRLFGPNGFLIKTEQLDGSSNVGNGTTTTNNHRGNNVPTLLQEIMDVEHLWQYNETELSRLNQPLSSSCGSGRGGTSTSTSPSSSVNANQMTNPLLASAGLSSNGDNTNPDLIANLCNVADHRLYKIVKWCKSLPLFKNISIDDQICLLINSWCELLLFSCCFRSIETPGEIKISQGKSMTLAQAKSNGLQSCIERMLNLTDHLRRLRVDRYEYVAMKVIMLLQSDTSELQEPVKVRECQEKALQSLQAYTLAHYPEAPSKFGELLLRIPELQRTCQLGKDTITMKSRDGGDFNLLMELLRGEH